MTILSIKHIYKAILGARSRGVVR